VSNSDGSVEESLGKAGFDGLFEFTLDSALVGSKKPEARIFEIALERLGLDRKSVWYVGDSVFHDIAGAAAAGLGRGVLVDPLGLSSLDAVPSVADLPRLLDTGLALGGGAA
ncbi:MAG: HAD family hydrolase, partial [Acidimicrobiia bacterium]|nr:HAD family hydrolase [Acidimicrobiia bacterium]